MKGYNYIYSELVEDSDDILGIIAYSFYKQQKIDFIQAFNEKNERSPTDEEMNVFFITSNSAASLASYRIKAETLARDFVNTVLADQLQEIQNKSDQELTKRIKTLSPPFWQGVAQNIFASILFVLLIGLMFFLSWSSKLSATSLIEHIMDVEIHDRAATPDPDEP
jgi:hypothetical protein